MTVTFTASTQQGSTLMRSFERTVVTDTGSAARTNHELWTIQPMAKP